MNTRTFRDRGFGAVAFLSSAALLAGCSAGGGGADGDVTLSLATSQPEETPNYYCGAELLKERVEAADVGVSIDLFPSSQLGPDSERLDQVQSGDIDIDLQGTAQVSSVFEPIGVLDAAYAFESVDHHFDWIDNYSEDFLQAYNEASDTTIVDGWYFGTRTFMSTEPIYSPDDLKGLQIRFPDEPTFIRNANALGVNPVAVASEEVYVALQQGIADGQENPVVASEAQSYDEVTDYVSLNDHQIGIQWVVVSDRTLEKLNEEQQEVLIEEIRGIRAENRACVDEETEEVLDDWRANGPLEVIEQEDIDMDAFISQAEEYFLDHLTGEDLELYEQIRATAP